MYLLGWYKNNIINTYYKRYKKVPDIFIFTNYENDTYIKAFGYIYIYIINIIRGYWSKNSFWLTAASVAIGIFT